MMEVMALITLDIKERAHTYIHVTE